MLTTGQDACAGNPTVEPGRLEALRNVVCVCGENGLPDRDRERRTRRTGAWCHRQAVIGSRAMKIRSVQKSREAEKTKNENDEQEILTILRQIDGSRES